ncbi:putative protein 178L [Cricket iridovirus]|uniref:178L n=2 Tax=Iridovirus TaxID=10487 RepID=Q91FY6_IIV6|nr:178L [Invertebrate iridescent virus 6]AAK82046.1 178L [Invertebrate iridescent virus 6]QMS79555.1 hypothetical protein IIV6-T1_178 [Invertebrate iridescent virus 6]QNH08588.1 178L [Invertebrate iridescent virus Kaz2018]UIB20783.1 putative protein 178L [Cricket iridovirus]
MAAAKLILISCPDSFFFTKRIALPELTNLVNLSILCLLTKSGKVKD